jgi:hypothetical protein
MNKNGKRRKTFSNLKQYLAETVNTKSPLGQSPSSESGSDLLLRYSFDSVSDVELISFPPIPEEPDMPLGERIQRSLGVEQTTENKNKTKHDSSLFYMHNNAERIRGHRGFEIQKGTIRKISNNSSSTHYLKSDSSESEKSTEYSISKQNNPPDVQNRLLNINESSTDSLKSEYETPIDDVQNKRLSLLKSTRNSLVDDYYFYNSIKRNYIATQQSTSIELKRTSSCEIPIIESEVIISNTNPFPGIFGSSGGGYSKSEISLDSIRKEAGKAVYKIENILTDVDSFMRDLESN